MSNNTHITATACAVSKQPGVAHVTSMGGHLPDVLKCIDCGKEYTVDYNPADRNRIADFENRLRTAAQQAIDNSHPFHGNYVEITELAGPPIPT